MPSRLQLQIGLSWKNESAVNSYRINATRINFSVTQSNLIREERPIIPGVLIRFGTLPDVRLSRYSEGTHQTFHLTHKPELTNWAVCSSAPRNE